MLRHLCWMILIVTGCFEAFGQRTFFQAVDSIHKPRLIGTSAAIGSIWTASMIGLSQVWYADYPKSTFHTFNDSREWMQMDKMGHVFSAYHLSKQTAKLYHWSGLTQNKSAWLGAGIGWGYQLSFEFLDGKNAAWGFSWSDVAANTVGSGLFLAQELWAKKQLFTLKFMYSPSSYATIRPEVLGSNFSERLMKDYNGQTYWISASPGVLFPKSHVPKWIALAVGYSVDAKLVGHADVYQDPKSLQFYHARREFILSLDIDVNQLPIRKPWIKKMLSPFNTLKIPFPALILRGNGIEGKWLYF